MKLSSILYLAGFGSILLSAANYLGGKTQTGGEGERQGIFVGHWAPTFFILAKVIEDREAKGEENPVHL